MTGLTVFVTRDSVAAGDDFDAPHPYSFKMKKTAQLRDALERLANKGYLATVAGRGHRWEAKIGDCTVATLAANNHRPAQSKVLASPLIEWAESDQIGLHFRYHPATY